MATLTVRAAVPDDAEAIARILNRIIAARTYTAFDTPFTVDAERRFIESFPARGTFLVAIDEGVGIVGFQNVEPFATFTRAFDHVGVIGTFVDLDCRRRGIAHRLFEATFAAAGANGFEKLFAYIRADNAPAIAAYERHGFGVIGTARRHARIDGRYIDELMVEKWL